MTVLLMTLSTCTHTHTTRHFFFYLFNLRHVTFNPPWFSFNWTIAAVRGHFHFSVGTVRIKCVQYDPGVTPLTSNLESHCLLGLVQYPQATVSCICFISWIPSVNVVKDSKYWSFLCSTWRCSHLQQLFATDKVPSAGRVNKILS